ncbi:hypothetical protein [Paenibacillus lentus]|uniref:Uncharacterized protein n=1 Tax=Paenibacillus lentus TaxID=1338368 RepID=A0A3Q8S6Y7_9BACL|nr:hypothetical protein [Paenibacillus lentus]AZK48634.1 hypothetical protein EIM92_22650 [Paenibacillus lentus]
MKNIAIAMLLLLLLSVFLEPVVELMYLGKEKVVLGSALSNAARSARDRSLNYEFHRNLDAVVDEEKFVEYFAKAFSDALKLTWTNEGLSSRELTFESTNDKYNEFTVTVEFTEEKNEITELITTKVELKAQSEYKFQTKYLRLAEDAGQDVAYQLESQREFTLSVKN